MLFIIFLPLYFSEHKGTKNPAQFDMNGKIFVVKECQAIIDGRLSRQYLSLTALFLLLHIGYSDIEQSHCMKYLY